MTAPLAALVAELRALHDLATPGKWKTGAYHSAIAGMNALAIVEVDAKPSGWPPAHCYGGDIQCKHNAQYIAALRNAAPTLMDAAERVVRLEATIARIADDMTPDGFATWEEAWEHLSMMKTRLRAALSEGDSK